ncbi:MAG: VTT domain-containing protein [Candidatus Korarchaeum sp.]|nr:VTT domain-containing protein [Candidatus Korarchaeum sp.]MDW8035027.1 VTT domain-containing protein [Candidatus Korarchaeum sp.]
MEGIVQGVTEAVKFWVRSLGAPGIFLGVMVETLITVIPSPLVPMIAGFSLIPSGSDILNALLYSMTVIGLTGSLAATLGALIHYWMGLYGGKVMVERYGKYLGVGSRDLERFSSKFNDKRRDFSLLMLRIIPIFPLSVVSVGAGILRIELVPYTLLTLLGSFVRYTFLGLLGFLMGETYEAISSWLDKIENFLIIAVIITLVLYLAYRRMSRDGSPY